MSDQPMHEQNPDLDQEEQEQYPPETYSLLSWSAIRFIRSPSSDFLMWSVIGVALTCIIAVIISAFIKMDVTVRGPGKVVSDFGSRDTLAPSTGQITEILKKVGDKVQEDEIIALIKIDSKTQKKISDTLETLENLEKKVRFYQDSKVVDFTIEPAPTIQGIESGPALDAMITLEQQTKSFSDQRTRLKKGTNTELTPLRKRAALLEEKVRKMKNSRQKQFLGSFLESTEEELGRIKNQILTSENESKLRMEQAQGEYLKSIQSAVGALKNYLDLRSIRSPISGQLSDLFVRPNANIEMGKQAARIVPENSKMMVSVHLFSRDIVKVAEGNPTLLKVEAYPYQTYGSFTGQVLSFEQAKEADAALGDYVVYSSIEFPKNLTDDVKKQMRLIIGMKLNAEIVVERKSGSSILKKVVFQKQ